jgi:hypothetical protein
VCVIFFFIENMVYLLQEIENTEEILGHLRFLGHLNLAKPTKFFSKDLSTNKKNTHPDGFQVPTKKF